LRVAGRCCWTLRKVCLSQSRILIPYSCADIYLATPPTKAQEEALESPSARPLTRSRMPVSASSVDDASVTVPPNALAFPVVSDSLAVPPRVSAFPVRIMSGPIFPNASPTPLRPGQPLVDALDIEIRVTRPETPARWLGETAFTARMLLRPLATEKGLEPGIEQLSLAIVQAELEVDMSFDSTTEELFSTEPVFCRLREENIHRIFELLVRSGITLTPWFVVPKTQHKTSIPATVTDVTESAMLRYLRNGYHYPLNRPMAQGSGFAEKQTGGNTS
jgi:hypothetical protein